MQRRIVSPAAAVAAMLFRVRFYSPLPQRRMVPPAAVVAATTFRVRFYFSLPQRRMGPPAAAVAATMSASDSNLRCRKGEWLHLQQSSRKRSSTSDSNLRCRKEEWPACSGRRGSDLPRPILISVAAKKNGFACRPPLTHGCIDS